MFTTAIVAVAAVASVVSAAPVARGKPSSYAEGYLENYDVYHTRYLALDCEDKHDTTFFDDCCHPLLATENLKDNRKAYCTPSAAALTSAVSQAAATTTASDDDSGSDFASATSSVEAVHSKVTASATASADDNNWTTALATSSSVDNNNNYAQPQSTSTSQQAQQTQAQQSSGGGGDDHFGGYATYFYQGGNAGACGTVHSDYDKVIAIDIDLYGNTGSVSGTCGKWITLTNTNNGRSTTAMVADVCPTCANTNSLDLSVGAFQAIADLGDGQVPISWHFD